MLAKRKVFPHAPQQKTAGTARSSEKPVLHPRLCRRFRRSHFDRAPVNRSTFYKYYSGKNALVQELFAEQKEQVRSRLESLLAQQCSLEEAAAALFAIQRESMTELYSAPVLDDIANVADLELERFFRSMEEEKYQFMRSFFHTLQQRKLIHHSLPPALIDLFIRQMDSLMRHPGLAELYAPAPQRLPQDILQLLLYGLTSREAE